MSRLTEATSAGSFDSIGDIWLEELENGIPVDDMLLVVRSLHDADRTDIAKELAELAIDVMDDGGNADLPVFLKGTADIFGVFEAFRISLIESIRDEYLMFQPLELFLKKSGLSCEGAEVSTSWSSFMNLMKYSEGGFVFHPTFGPGKVLRISRTFIIIDFEKAPEHEMNLEIALETAVPLTSDSLALLKWQDPPAFNELLASDPREFLLRLFREPFGSPGEVSRQDLNPSLTDSSMPPAELWKVLKKAAAATSGVSDLGDRIILREATLSSAGQMARILDDRRIPASEMTREIQAILGSAGKIDSDTRERLLGKVLSLKRPETGALFELAWMLSGSRKLVPEEAPTAKFVERSAARAGRALGEIHSLSCRKQYLEAFLSSRTGSGEKIQLLSKLKRSMWEHCAVYLEKTNPDILHENIGIFLSDPSETDRFLWALSYCAESESPLDAPSGREHLELLLRNLVFAKAETQKRVIGLLLGTLKEELDSYLTSSDTRMLLNLLDSLDGSLTAHREGLFLAVNRELAKRKESKPVKRQLRRFWESELLFSSKASIERRIEEILRLRQVNIPAAADAIGVAASHGDLSENAEYAAAIERRDLLLDKLRRWEEEMEKYRPYPGIEISASICSPGTRVRLAVPDRLDIPEKELELVGPLDADPANGKINYRAPLGSILLGRSPGDMIELPLDEDLSWEVIGLEVLEEVSGS